jgi:hypothetical protein
MVNGRILPEVIPIMGIDVCLGDIGDIEDGSDSQPENNVLDKIRAIRMAIIVRVFLVFISLLL